jgi:hypothetical protein
MRFDLRPLLAAPAVALFSAPASALLIDAFNGTTTQTATINGGSGVVQISPQNVTVGGLTRNGSINAPQDGNYDANINDVSGGFPGVAAFSNGTGDSRSLMELTYTGLLDLSALSRIMFDIDQLDNELVTFGVELTDGSANSFMVTEQLTSSGTFSAQLADFTDVDLADVTTLTVSGDSRVGAGDIAADWEIDNIRAAPLPGTFALLTLGLAGVGASRFRRC